MNNSPHLAQGLNMYHKMEMEVEVEVEKINFNRLFWALKENNINFAPNTGITQQKNSIMFALNNGRGLEGRLFIIGQCHSEGPTFCNLFNKDKFNSIDEKRLITPLKMLLDSSELVKSQILDALKILKPTIYESIIQKSLEISALENNAANNQRLTEQENRLSDYFFSILAQRKSESEESPQQYYTKYLR